MPFDKLSRTSQVEEGDLFTLLDFWTKHAPHPIALIRYAIISFMFCLVSSQCVAQVPADTSNVIIDAPYDLTRSVALPLIQEPGLAARRARHKSSTLRRIAIAPVRAIQFPFRVLNYPLEKWVIIKDPPEWIFSTRNILRSMDRVGITPSVGGFGTGSGFGGGLWLRAPEQVMGRYRLLLYGGTTNRAYQKYTAQLDHIKIGRVHVEVKAGLLKQPEEDFFGSGLSSREQDRSTYNLETTSYSVLAKTPLGRRFNVRASIGFSRNTVREGRDSELPSANALFDPNKVVGLQGRFSFMDYEAQATWDNRDHPRYPRGGSYARAGFQFSDGIEGTRSRFVKYKLNLQHFIKLPGYRKILAMRFLGTATDKLDPESAGVPVFRLEQMGGSATHRMLKDFRYTDEDMVLANLEYRFPFWFIEHESGIALDSLLFFDFGSVLSDLGKLQGRDLRTGYGFGFRLATPNTPIFRLDIGWTVDDNRVDLGIEGPF